MSGTVSRTYDYVVVGAGSAGCVLANRLSADPLTSVCLIEAGPRDRDPWIHIPAGYFYNIDSPKLSWQYRTEPDPGIEGRSIVYPRGRVLGGTSSINGMLYHRGQAADYDRWRALGNEGWGWEDVLPFFRRFEDHADGGDAVHGAGAELRVARPRIGWEVLDAFLAAAVETGVERRANFNGGINDGVGHIEVSQRNGLRESAATAFLRPAYRRPNLTVLTGALARKLVLDGRRATGVAIERQGRQETVLACREVVLAAGAIGSPQILMLSGIGPAPHLKERGIEPVHHLPEVGANLQEHLTVRAAFRVSGARTVNGAFHSRLSRAKALLDFLMFRKGLLTMPPGTVNAFVRSSPAAETADVQLLAFPMTYDLPGEPPHRFPGFSVNVVLLRPESRGSVRLKSPDPQVAPAIHFGFLSAERDRAPVVAGLKMVRAICAAPALARFRPQEIRPGPEVAGDEALGHAVSRLGQSSCHAAGTCRMGVEETAVVDPRLRVRGIDALRVVDASIMPRLVSGNTNAPAMMIGEKGAAMILADR